MAGKARWESDAVENLVKKYGFGVKIVAPEIWSTRNGNIRTDHLPRSLLRIVRGQSFLQELQARYPDELSLSASTLRPLARSRGYSTCAVRTWCSALALTSAASVRGGKNAARLFVVIRPN